MSQTVFVSGFTGYIALHIVKQLLEKGYKVIGSVRSAAKGDQYSGYIDDDNFSYVIVEDISVAGAFDEAFKTHPEIETVYHVASPVVFEFEDVDKDVYNPAVEGTRSIFKSAKVYGPNVKKMILTSSNAAHNSPLDHYGKIDNIVNEDSVSSLSKEEATGHPSFAYWASKKLAMDAAKEFMASETPQYSLTAVSPTWCFGPQAYDEVAKGKLASTGAIFEAVMNLKKDDPVTNGDGISVDVRDIAKLHIMGAELPQAEGKILLLDNGKYNESLMLNVIHEKFPQFNGRLPKPEKINREDIKCASVDSTRTQKLVGLEPLSFETSIVDAVNQLIKVRGI